MTQATPTIDVTTRSPDRAPGPRGTPLLGSLNEFRRDALGFLQRAVEEHGDIVRFRFGPVTAHLLNRPEYVERVLVSGGHHYDKRTRSVAKIHATCGDSLLSTDGQRWLRHRRLMQPFFQPQYLDGFARVIDSVTEDVVQRWRRIEATGQQLDIVSEMMRLTLTIAAKVLFTSDVHRDTAVIERSLATILEDTWRRLESPVDLSAISPVFHRRKFRKALREIDQVVFRMIEDRRASGVERNDLLSALLGAHQAESGTRLSDRELRDAVLTLLLAGHETTANALAWTFYLISRSPETESLLHHESLAGSKATDGQSRLSATARAFCEAIRIYPSIWIIERRVVREDSIDGYRIPRGSTVMLSPYLIHRHPEFWPNPDAYDPDRFATSQASERPRHAYIPFGVGAHKCIGEHLAILVATRILRRVYRDFRLRLVPDQSIEMLPGITLRHRHPLKMTLQRRCPCECNPSQAN